MSTHRWHRGIVGRVEGRLQRALGANLRAVRLSLGLSQEQMAEHVDWHRTYVGAIERGERNLTLRSVERLALVLELDPLELLREGGAEPEVT